MPAGAPRRTKTRAWKGFRTQGTTVQPPPNRRSSPAPSSTSTPTTTAWATPATRPPLSKGATTASRTTQRLLARTRSPDPTDDGRVRPGQRRFPAEAHGPRGARHGEEGQYPDAARSGPADRPHARPRPRAACTQAADPGRHDLRGLRHRHRPNYQPSGRPQRRPQRGGERHDRLYGGQRPGRPQLPGGGRLRRGSRAPRPPPPPARPRHKQRP